MADSGTESDIIPSYPGSPAPTVPQPRPGYVQRQHGDHIFREYPDLATRRMNPSREELGLVVEIDTIEKVVPEGHYEEHNHVMSRIRLRAESYTLQKMAKDSPRDKKGKLQKVHPAEFSNLVKKLIGSVKIGRNKSERCSLPPSIDPSRSSTVSHLNPTKHPPSPL